MNGGLGTGSPRVLVTGAAGRLGRAVSARLHAEDVDLVATDIVVPAEVPYCFEQADLLDHETTRQMLDGIDVVLHIGNRPGIGSTPPQIVFNQNVSMNENVFQGAAEAGVKRIVFASTLQMIGSHTDHRTVVDQPPPPAYPMDETTVPAPSNVYALSKTVSEVMLRYYADRCGIDSVAIRFPLLHNHEHWVGVSSGDETYTDLLEGFTGLSYHDAAALFLVILETDLPGFRIYAPGTAHRHRDLKFPDLLHTHYPNVPGSVTDLIDVSTIVQETGWRLGVGYDSPVDR